MWGKEKAQTKLLGNLEEHFLKVHRAHHLPVGDFPDCTKFRQCMEGHDLSKFPKLEAKMVESMDLVLSRDIPRLMAMFPQEGTHDNSASSAMAESIAHVGSNLSQASLHSAAPPAAPAPPSYQSQPSGGGYAANYATPAPPPPQSTPSYSQPPPAAPPPAAPTGGPFGEAPPTSGGGVAWAISADDKSRYEEVFRSLGPTNGLVSGMAVRPVLERSNLPQTVLREVWNLSDIDRDGHLDADEFAVAMHLARDATSGKTLPATLPPSLIPPSKR